MQLPRSAALVPRLEILEHAGSTNDELGRRAVSGPHRPEEWPDFSVLVTDDQRAGRGRLGRAWVAPAGKTLAVSVLLRPVTENGAPLAGDGYGWLPLLAGVAMARAVQGLGADARVKWPNDVLIAGRKVCGVLSELLPASATAATGQTRDAPSNLTSAATRDTTAASAGAPAPAVILGAGINLTLGAEELPVETATSLRIAGILDPEPDAVLAAYLTELNKLYRGILAADGDAVASGITDAVRDVCETLGRAVRVELPGGDVLVGTAVDIDETGRLVVDTADGKAPDVSPSAPHAADSNTSDPHVVNGRRTAVAAGDVTHLRY